MYKMSNSDHPFIRGSALEGDDRPAPPTGHPSTGRRLTDDEREQATKYRTDPRFTVPPTDDLHGGGRRSKKRPTARRRRSSKSRKARKARATRRR